MWVLDAMKAWDILSIEHMTGKTISFTRKGHPGFVSHVSATLNNFNFMGIDMCAKFRREIENHEMLRMAHALNIWVTLIQQKDEVTPFKLETIGSVARCDSLFVKFDESALPVYFEDAKLHDVMYPSVSKVVRAFTSVMRVLCVPKTEVQEAIAECEATVEGTSWGPFVAFVKEGCVAFQATDDADIFVIGSAILAAKFCGTMSQAKETLRAALTASSEKLKASLDACGLPEIFATRRSE